ncbi:MAG TPA: exodeoxyribonuclease VII large subunit [Gemmatimonadales bacterium]|nr:exodeoxyribonuclease VII large subunit [Gemmatimonadales bacterium]
MTLTLPLESPVPADDVWSVSQITTAVKKLIERGAVPVWVRGEVLQCKAWSSGHWYFTLRDDRSQFRCCMWKQNAMRAGKPPADGTEVYAFGTPGLWEEKGEFRFTVTSLIPTALIGQQQQELERVKALLQKEGLFDAARKRRMPALASCIAIVTSSDGAALRDIVTVTRRRWPAARLIVVSARVQGDGSAAEIARALQVVNRLPDVEICIVGRGGGAREDLAAFNDERVCRALAAVRVPTISAVGHETDISLTDLVADLRAPTPSAAAEAAVADRRDVLRLVDDLATRLGTGLSLRTSLAGERLERMADRLSCSVRDLIAARRNRSERLAAELNALSPLRVLQRGYAVPTTLDGVILKRTGDFVPDLSFKLRVADGEVRARVESDR